MGVPGFAFIGHSLMGWLKRARATIFKMPAGKTDQTESRTRVNSFQGLSCLMLEEDCAPKLPDKASVLPVGTNSAILYTSARLYPGAAFVLGALAWMFIGKRWKRGGGAIQHQAGHKDRLDENAKHGAAAAAVQETVNEALPVQPMVDFLLPDGPNLDLLESDGEPTSGDFGDVQFFKDKTTGELLALKTSKGTAAGMTQILVEINFLCDMADGVCRNIVQVRESTIVPIPMLLLKKEPTTLRCMEDSLRATKPAEIVKVLGGILTAVEFISSVGYLHRDITPESILVSEDGEGVLADFGLCIKKESAVLPANVGVGNVDYSAMEVATTGSCLCSDLFSISVCFLESMLGRNPFDGKELLSASEGRRSYLAGVREATLVGAKDIVDNIKVWMKTFPGNETVFHKAERAAFLREVAETNSRLEETRRMEWRLGARSGNWKPDRVALKALKRLERPLAVYVKPLETDTRTREDREDAARVEAKGFPEKVFEGKWIEWLPGTGRAPCDNGLQKVVAFVLGNGMINPNPGRRPQSTEALRGLLHGALRVYFGFEGTQLTR